MSESSIVRDRVIDIIMEIIPNINTETITDETALISKGLLDSLGFLTLAMHIQEEFGIEIPFDEHSPEEFTLFGTFVSICEDTIARHNKSDDQRG